jgi:hypothetical protein
MARMHIRLSEKDRNRLLLIKEVFGVSMAGAIRVSIRAAAEKLGLERPTPDDFIRK